MGKKRRGSRLFSGQPGLLLVSEDIPGIIMPAPPSIAELPPLEEEDDVFDIEALHAEEDAEESAGQQGPLRVFLGAPGTDAEPSEESPAEAVAEAADDGPIWDVSALAMPEAPGEDAEESLEFLDEGHDVSDDDVVALDTAPPPLVMKVSLDDDPGLSPGDWAEDDGPTVPAMPAMLAGGLKKGSDRSERRSEELCCSAPVGLSSMSPSCTDTGGGAPPIPPAVLDDAASTVLPSEAAGSALLPPIPASSASSSPSSSVWASCSSSTGRKRL